MKKLHEKAVDSMEKKILTVLNSIKIENGNLSLKDSWPNLNLLFSEMKKHFKDEISLSFVYRSIFDFTTNALSEKHAIDYSRLQDCLGEEPLSNLANSIFSYFLSLPKTYSFYFPIGKLEFQMPKKFELMEGIEIVYIEAQSIKKSLLGVYALSDLYLPPSNFPQVDSYCLKLDAEGVFAGDMGDSAFKRAYERLKHLLTYGLAKKSFTINGKISNPGCVSVKYWCFCEDKCGDKISSEFIQIPGNLGEGLNLLQVNVKSTSELISSFTDLEKLYKSETDVKDIFSAMEWAFDANYASDQTMAFLNVCFGLESLLGDDGDQGGLTEKMADRCSYIAATARENRKAIRENFKELYKIRSKIVHGRRKCLSDDEVKYRFYGHDLLEFLILKEIEAAIK